MSSFFLLIWLIVVTKNVLFWLYLWQLKEYHIGRFLVHFRTEKGKRLLFNWIILSKLILVSIIFLGLKFSGAGVTGFLLLWLVYFLGAVAAIINIIQKRIKKPVLTLKTSFLIFISLFVEIIFSLLVFINLKGNFLFFTLGLLIFDILTPLIVSIIVLLFQPLAVFLRDRIIKRAIRNREQFKDLIVVGITGSYGKTSVKEFLSTILEEKFRVLKTKEHQNSEIGIAQCIVNELKPEHQIFVCEMGAYNVGRIKLLCNIAKPKIGILTGINQQHLATFGSLENIINTKFELLECLPEGGTAIINNNDEIIKKSGFKIEKLKCKKIKFISTKEKADVWAEDIIVEKDSISFKAVSPNLDSANFNLNLMGQQNIENLLLAICCAKELGMRMEEIGQAAKKIDKKQSGIILKKTINGLNLIDSTYSANLDGVFAHLEYLKNWSGRKIIIMPCLIELGKVAGELHKKIGEKIAEVCNLAIITTKDYFKEIKNGAVNKGMAPEKIIFSDNPDEIVTRAKDFNKENDIILLEGRLSKEIMRILIKE